MKKLDEYVKEFEMLDWSNLEPTDETLVERVKRVHKILEEMREKRPWEYRFAHGVSRRLRYEEDLGDKLNSIYSIPCDELIRLEILREIKEDIKQDLLDGDPSWFCEPLYENESEFRRGVWAAIRLLTHRIDCIID